MLHLVKKKKPYPSSYSDWENNSRCPKQEKCTIESIGKRRTSKRQEKRMRIGERL